MADLTAKRRDTLPASKFGEPSVRKYPVDTEARAKNAKSRASEMANKGKLSGAAEKAIDRKADAVIARLSKPKPVR